ncbi:lysophosphatidylcholine acyltransferase [Teleopsis dalmanni]|uniref:lysophosphatidylcholine acyltransferase n=1 Tax=Teleopsis dalmanni TaxID=139649 RepID=UPI0018CE644E|nr:lysophosphatidylcholine acyltransferase [Teleopsis dalmanni]
MTTSTLKPHNSKTPKENNEADANSTSSLTAIEKTDSEDNSWASDGFNYINPFVHRVNIDNHVDLAKIYVLSVLLLPFRVVGCVLSLVSAWMFACIGLYGMTLDDLKIKPLTGWRRQLQRLTAGCMRMVYASGSFHYITFKGERASPKEAPIMVVAPHSSYVDSIIVVATGPPSIVAKQETSQIPLLGKIINYAQPIYVQREDPNSRQNTIREIVDRARSKDEWPQVVIFAEGTCTNRTALIKFKPGAFYPGVPVQPVLLKYPNKYDTFTWTWDGPGVLRLLWMTMSQFYSRCEIEFLPVYNPTEEEKNNANLYARNVREVMAKALQVPTSEYSFEDVIVMSRARDMKIPFPGDVVEIEHTLYKLGLLDCDRDVELACEYRSFGNTEKIDCLTFSELLQVDISNPHFRKLFSLLDHRHSGTVSLKSFLLCSFFCKVKNDEIVAFLETIVQIYAESKDCIKREEFCKIMKHATRMTDEKASALFIAIDQSHTGYITFEDFTNYSRELPKYQYIYKKQEHIRRTYNNSKMKIQ